MAYDSHTSFEPDQTTVTKYDNGITVTSTKERRVFSERRSRFLAFSPNRDTSFSLLKIVFCLLLISLVFTALSGGTGSKTFTGLLNWLSDFHPAISNVTFKSSAILSDWGIFDGLRVLINMLVTIADVVVFLCKGLINCISYITGFFAFLFS